MSFTYNNYPVVSSKNGMFIYQMKRQVKYQCWLINISKLEIDCYTLIKLLDLDESHISDIYEIEG